MRIQKELCGFLNSTLHLYEKIDGDLEPHVFDINPYNTFVANKTVDRKQLKIKWHVDNLKISHVDRKFVSTIILWMESVCGKMYSNRVKRHEYLDMWI